jgi:UDP-glucose 4-epimerase
LISGRSIDLQFVRVRPGDVRDSQADNSRLRMLMPGARDSDLDLGLRATIDWFSSGKTDFPDPTSRCDFVHTGPSGRS